MTASFSPPYNLTQTHDDPPAGRRKKCHPACLLATVVLFAQPLYAAADDCLVIAHRGASGHAPEHTLTAYRLALQMGADYLEPDLVLTRDGIPIARHEAGLTRTTDVAQRPEFAARAKEKLVMGKKVRDWYAEDFTLAEIQTLRSIERIPEIRPDNARMNGLFPVPTLQAIIDLVEDHWQRTGRMPGLYPEIKTQSGPEDADAAQILIDILESNQLNGADSPVFIQSFDPAVLKRVDPLSPLQLVQLLPSTDQLGEEFSVPSFYELQKISVYADGIGVPKSIRPKPDDPEDPQSLDHLVRQANRAGLFVHVYTFRAENHFLPTEYQVGEKPDRRGDLSAELGDYLDAGINGFFIDQPGSGRRVCDSRALERKK